MCRHLEHLEIIRRTIFRTFDLITENQNFMTLKVGGCQNLGCVTINAPNLKSFYFHGCIHMISVQGCILERVFVSYIPATSFIPVRRFTMDPLAPYVASLNVLIADILFITVSECQALVPVFPRGDLSAGRSLFPNLTELYVYMEAFTYLTVGRLLNLLKRCRPFIST